MNNLSFDFPLGLSDSYTRIGTQFYGKIKEQKQFNNKKTNNNKTKLLYLN